MGEKKVQILNPREKAKSLPSNSNKTKRPKVQKVVTGGVKTRKPSPFKRLKENLVEEDSTTVKQYIFFDFTRNQKHYSRFPDKYYKHGVIWRREARIIGET